MEKPVLEKINCTPFAADFGLCNDKDGAEIAVAVLKATFIFDAKGVVSAAGEKRQLPVFQSDRYFDKLENSGLRYASDIMPDKVGTDIAVNGSVYAFKKACVAAGFTINNLKKEILAFGERRLRMNVVSSIDSPEPFDRLPLRYERAYGGTYRMKDGRVCSYPYNPVGMGFAEKAVDGMPLPSFEYRNNLLKDINSRTYPAGLGFIPSHWQQRYRFAGTFDETWHENRRPLLPADFDPRFYNTVSPDQVYLPKIQGGEKIALHYLHPEVGEIALEIPRKKFMSILKIKGEGREITMAIDTVLIEPDEGRFCIAYRASCPIGNDFRYLRAVVYKEC